MLVLVICKVFIRRLHFASVLQYLQSFVQPNLTFGLINPMSFLDIVFRERFNVSICSFFNGRYTLYQLPILKR